MQALFQLGNLGFQARDRGRLYWHRHG
jgi:hypothetical protein